MESREGAVSDRSRAEDDEGGREGDRHRKFQRDGALGRENSGPVPCDGQMTVSVTKHYTGWL